MIILVLLWGVVRAGELSTSVFLSEDELDEALRNGELTPDQYQNLREIMQYGIDSLSQYMLDEIPNLMYLLDVDSASLDLLEQEQTSGFSSKVRKERTKGTLRWRFTSMLEEDTHSWYRGSVDLRPVEDWRLRMQINREASGAERVTARSLSYANRSGLVRRIEIGSFTTRFGLGAAFGYRGKLLALSKELNGESFAYPDFGGYNGVMAELRTGSLTVQSLGSIVRDEQYQFATAGVSVEDAAGRIRPGLVMGISRIKNRITGAVTAIPVASFFVYSQYDQGSIATELTCQESGSSKAVCAVAEGHHRFQRIELRYAGWHYSDDFVDLTAGSKSIPIYNRDTLEIPEFSFRSRRTGQSGGMVKTQVPLSEPLSCSASLLYGEAMGSRRQQFSGSLIHRSGPAWRLQLTYLGKWQRRPAVTPVSDSDDQWRLESRYEAGPWRVRCYIGYEDDYEGQRYGSLFVSAKYETNTGERYQVWSNMGKLDKDGIIYWYLFGRGEWSFGERMTGAAKLSNSCRRDSADRNVTQFSVELVLSL